MSKEFTSIMKVHANLSRNQAELLQKQADIEAREEALKKAEQDQEEFICQLLTQIGELAGENAHLSRVIEMYREKELSMIREKNSLKEEIKSLMETLQKQIK